MPRKAKEASPMRNCERYIRYLQRSTAWRRQGRIRICNQPEGVKTEIQSKCGLWWAVEPNVCVLADGLSKELDGGIEDGRSINVGKESTSFCWGDVRRMWNDCLSRSSPHGWRQDEQLARELANILQCLSCPLALAEWERALEITFGYLCRMRQACEAIGAMRNSSITLDEAWQSLSQEDKDWVILAASKGRFVTEWPSVPRVATRVKDRVGRLRALGNAVVPQQIYPILKAIAEIERNKGD